MVQWSSDAKEALLLFSRVDWVGGYPTISTVEGSMLVRHDSKCASVVEHGIRRKRL